MAAEPLIDFLKIGYPIPAVSAGNYTTELVYIGPYADLASDAPAIGQPWGDYIGVTDLVRLEPLPGTNPAKGELFVTIVHSFESTSSDGTGTADESTHEIDWTVVNRPLMEHPEFQEGGFYSLEESDFPLIAAWEDDKSDTNFDALSSNAQKYAKGILIGLTTYDDYAPIATLTTGYINGPPPSSSAGSKDNPPSSFPNLPTGYEWRKAADRSLRAGRKNRWERVESWEGAKKVLVDKNELFY